ncbi:hypothetical protein [Actinomycetospora lemnae]|uniref:Uncharacterized protein n=1 Tax=Actinomycetospora lemnae TaxID=3019891 RepID=A0ABT5SMQ6_9PSEU|nr:hypothetical protein [Actinomycetospora sp. DW7H6]MDD7964124.1 hypothetical protein [Actinomycetospora sp. DW7H6]
MRPADRADVARRPSAALAAVVLPGVLPSVLPGVAPLGRLLLERVVEQAFQALDAPVGPATVEHDRFVGDTCLGE